MTEEGEAVETMMELAEVAETGTVPSETTHSGLEPASAPRALSEEVKSTAAKGSSREEPAFPCT